MNKFKFSNYKLPHMPDAALKQTVSSSGGNDLDEFDEACSHVIQDTFVDGIAWFESQGLRPELEEKDQKMKEDKQTHKQKNIMGILCCAC